MAVDYMRDRGDRIDAEMVDELMLLQKSLATFSPDDANCNDSLAQLEHALRRAIKDLSDSVMRAEMGRVG